MSILSKQEAPLPSSESASATARSPSATSGDRRSPRSVQRQLFLDPQAMSGSLSAISSSVASSPQQVSPMQSPQGFGITTATSIQPSPESGAVRGRDLDLAQLPPLDPLPDSLLSHRTSTSSLAQSYRASVPDASPTHSGPNVFRRLSNRVKTGGKNFRPSRRQSSTHATNRNTSVGPHVIRRGRSSSSATAPPESCGASAIASETEDELIEPSTPQTIYYEASHMREVFSPKSNTPSVAESSTMSELHAGPVVPLSLLKGTPITKVSKKRNRKRLTLTLDAEAGKIYWDKTKSSKWIYLDDIKEIRLAPDVRQYRLDCGVPEVDEPRFFTILQAVPDKKDKVVHFIADNDGSFAQWTTTLDALSKHRQELMASLMSFNDRAIQTYWYKEMSRVFADSSPSLEALKAGEIDFAGVERVCRNLHIHISSDKLKVRFEAADKKQNGRLDFTRFHAFVRSLAKREDTLGPYRSATRSPATGLSFAEFLTFLKEVQGESTEDESKWRAIFGHFATTAAVHATDADPAEERMSDADFASYLSSIHNTPLKDTPPKFTLDRPMSEYFISSSHNTYLLGRQVAGISSVEGYISAMMRGCRCVEVDCWDGPGQQPIVVHGRTMTSQIMFREVISTINKYAFAKSQFPLWISLEVHCNPVQQEVMAKTIIEIFGDRLIRQPLEEYKTTLPPPSALMGKILIKVKKPAMEESKPNELAVTGRKRGSSLTSPMMRGSSSDSISGTGVTLPPPSVPALRRDSNSDSITPITENVATDHISSASSEESSEEAGPSRVKQSRIIKVLGELGVYCMGLKFAGFDDLDCKTFNHILSFTERTFNKHSTKPEKGALFRHNMRYLMRVYPNQIRINSSNFDPLHYWKSGVQMAALNWQTFDLGMQINQAMFAAGTDTSGYVLKPEAFREIKMVPNLDIELYTKRERQKLSFTIDVISAQQLTRPINFGERRTVDPYVEVEVFLADDKRDKTEAVTNGQSRDNARPAKFRTQVVKGNGFNPIFDKKITFNLDTKYPDLAFVRFSVKLSENGNYSDRANPLATYTAKLNSLKQGYRTLPLFDYNGDQYLFSSLFCRIKVDPVTSFLVDYVSPEAVNKSKKLGIFSRNPSSSAKSSLDDVRTTDS